MAYYLHTNANNLAPQYVINAGLTHKFSTIKFQSLSIVKVPRGTFSIKQAKLS